METFRLPAISARLALLCLATITAALLVVAMWLPPASEPPAHGDLDTYAEVISDLRAGKPYYTALHERLLQHGYPTRSVFNWRPPAFMTILAVLPAMFWQPLLLALLVSAGAVAVRVVLRRYGRAEAISVGLLLALSLSAAIAPNAATMCELYAGGLILLSVCAYGLGQWRFGLMAAAGALFLRDIAGVYVLVCIAAALRERRRPELLAWAGVLAIYGVYYAFHAVNVASMLGPADRADAVGWLRFGGAEFVLLTAHFNGMMLLLPYWQAALLLPVAVLGLVHWSERVEPRALWTVLVFLVLFAFLGKPANSYWGALFTPLLSLGLVAAPSALKLLWQSARPSLRAVA